MSEELMTTEELADRWGFHISTIKAWRVHSKGPKYIKLGHGPRGKVRYRLKDILDYEKKFLKNTGS